MFAFLKSDRFRDALHEALDVILDAVEAENDSSTSDAVPANDVKPKAKPVAPRVRGYPAPLGSPNELDRARAKKMLRRRGLG
jgi:hypothetical protein